MFESLDLYSELLFVMNVDQWNRLVFDKMMFELVHAEVFLLISSYYRLNWEQENRPVVDRIEKHFEMMMMQPFEIFVEKFYKDSTVMEAEFLLVRCRMLFFDYLSFFSTMLMTMMTLSMN